MGGSPGPWSAVGGVAGERLAFVDAFAHLVEEVLLLSYRRLFELWDLADGVAQAAFHAHGSLWEAAAERRLFGARVVAELVSILSCLELVSLLLCAEVVFD